MAQAESKEKLEHLSEVIERESSVTDNLNARVLVIYTGGTIGMVNTSGAYEPKPNCMIANLKTMPIFHWPEGIHSLSEAERDDFLLLQPIVSGKRNVMYKVLEFDPLLDSCNMSGEDWIKIAECIKTNYALYDGFVVLHGTDTMAYTASALSFICENLGKPVILTGSQIPIFETRSDGRDNFLDSLIIAGNYYIPEVLVCFNEKVFRGNRTIKADSTSFDAFCSPNMPPLVKLEVEIKVDYPAIFRPMGMDKFDIHTSMCPNVCLLRLFPGITTQTVRAFLRPPVQGVVLQTFGAGNAPSRPDLLAVLGEASHWGVLIVNISQCSKGNVGASYATGLALREAGVIFGGDMTPEAALAKLSYVLGKEEWTLEQRKKKLGRNLRGELSSVVEERLDISDSELIGSVARYMSLSTNEEVKKVKEAIYPCLLCAAAQADDVPALEKLRSSGGDLGALNTDGRTPLHIAARHGHINVVHYLLNHGVSVHVKDYRGDGPLIDAIEGCHNDIIKLLTKTGATINLPNTYIAMRMCSAIAQDDSDQLSSWLLGGADPDCHDYDMRTPLHVAMTLKKEKLAETLIKAKASINLEDAFGYTSATIAEKLDFYHEGLRELIEDAKAREGT